MNTTKVQQVKNSDGTFTYLVNGQIFKMKSKRDYSYFLDEVGALSNSLKSIESTQSFWIKNGNESVNKDNLVIIEIEKN